MKNQVQLIAYVDRLSGGGFRDLQLLLDGPFAGLFGGVHLLPFFWSIDGADAGFDPIDHTKIDPRLGSWDDVRALAARTDLMTDVIVNHISTRFPQFEDFRRRGETSPYAQMFLTYGRIFPHGAGEEDLLNIYRPRPGLPFTRMHFDDGRDRLIWTTFTPEQVDIDVLSSPGKAYLRQILSEFHGAGIRAIRLDAAGYAIKRPGTSCFLIPETFDFIRGFSDEARARGMEVLVEIHTDYERQIETAKQVDWVYDFALPPLILHSLYTRDARHLKRWFEVSPRNAATVLDTHDGIGVRDVAGLLAPGEIDTLVETIDERSNGASRKATGAAANNLDLYQVNCTYYDALGQRDEEYLIARALQFFTPGVPQVYYVGLLAGANDLDLLHRTGSGRDINRHYYTRREIENDLARPVVRALLDLIRFRNTHPAFAGGFRLLPSENRVIRMEWRQERHWARLEADLRTMSATIGYSQDGEERTLAVGPNTAIEGHA
ncbi:MAG TPA: sucrose phosphorylase [Bryobacteraceae bacterium]